MRLPLFWRIAVIEGMLVAFVFSPVYAFGDENRTFNKETTSLPDSDAARRLTARDNSYASIKDFGAVCDGKTDDGRAIQKAVSASLHVNFPAGTCLVNSTVKLRSGNVLRGEGIKVSILKLGEADGASKGVFYVNSESRDSEVTDIHISGMTIDGQSNILGFSQFRHLISLNGARNVVIESMEFRAFRGDGLYIGSGVNGGDERHNTNILVKKNIFDGVDYSNRNGVSVIDGDGVIIEDNVFRQTTRNNMPGAIDIEPNEYAFHIVRNITIRRNKFYGIGGAVGAISFVLNSKTTATATKLLVEGNYVEGGGVGIFFMSKASQSIPSNRNDLIIKNNVVKTSGRSFVIRGANNFRIEGNDFSGADNSSLVGFKEATDKCLNGVIVDNEFKNIGGGKGDFVGISIFSIDHLEISRNKFIDIGGSATGSYAINFISGTSNYVHIASNVFRASKGKTAFAIHKEAAHIFTPSTSTFEGNKFIGTKGYSF